VLLNFGNLNLKLLHHAPYSPDLTPPDYFLFPKLKMDLKGNHFAYIKAFQKTVTEILKNIPETDFSHAMEKLADTTKMCMVCNGYYN